MKNCRNRAVLAFLTLISLAVPSLTAQGQTRRGSTLASNKPAARPIQKCSGAWTGSVTYTRTQATSDNKTVQRVSARGEDTKSFEMRYSYTARVAVLESPEGNGSSTGRGMVNHEFSSSETTKAVEKNSCDRGKTWRDMSGTFTSETRTTGSEAVEANVSVGVNADGTYSVSVGLPQIQGQTTGRQTSSFSGQCAPKEGKNLTLPATATRIDGNSLSSDGTHRVDPSDPNRLSGSYTSTWQNVTETITWTLQKCGGPLRITDLKFEDMKFPNWEDWQEIVEQKGTIDGNLVRIKAKVLNASGDEKYAEVTFKETYKGDKWDGARPDAPLKDQTVSVRLEPGEEREVEILWDSSGYAWFDDGRPRLVQRVKAEVSENSKTADEMTRNLKIAPKPLVLVHGLWSNWRAWEAWQNILTTSHSYDWKAFPVGERPDKGIMDTGGEFLSTSPTKSIAENARELEKYIRYAQEDRNAWHVDIVAHSMGGLISRYYISQIMPADRGDFRPPVSRLVMLGTPNMGSPCADVMNVVFESLGKNVEAVRQLRTDYAEGFNRINTNRKGVKFSVLAGDPLPTMCKSVVWNDGVVPVPSAVWQIADHARSKSVHTDLTGTSDFSTFVKPRLAIGPRGDHNPAVPDLPRGAAGVARSGWDRSADEAGDFARAFSELRFLDLEPPVRGRENAFAKSVSIPGKGAIEVDVPVPAAKNFGLTFMAAPSISVTLLDPAGRPAGKNVAGSRESNVWFRSIFVDRTVAAGTWKIRVENTGDREMEIVLTTWENAEK